MTREEIKRLADEYADAVARDVILRNENRISRAHAALHAAIDAEHTRAEQLAADSAANKHGWDSSFHQAMENGAKANEQRDRAERAEAALRELVALKDIKERYEKCWPSDPEAPELIREYSMRRDPAWAAARAIVEGEGR